MENYDRIFLESKIFSSASWGKLGWCYLSEQKTSDCFVGESSLRDVVMMNVVLLVDLFSCLSDVLVHPFSPLWTSKIVLETQNKYSTEEVRENDGVSGQEGKNQCVYSESASMVIGWRVERSVCFSFGRLWLFAQNVWLDVSWNNRTTPGGFSVWLQPKQTKGQRRQVSI